MKKQLLFLLSFFISTAIYSQNKSDKLLGSWYMYHGNHIVSEQISLISGFQLRTYEAINNHNLSFGYFGVSYHLKNNFDTGIRYGYLEIDRSIEFTDQPNAIEHRLMEHLSHRYTIKKHKILQRVQLEQRFIHFIESNTIQNRIRYRLGYQYNLLKWLILDTSNEFFFHDDKKSYRENRFYAGFHIKTSKYSSLKLGYMKQYINDNYLDRLQLGITLKTDFR